MKIEIDDNSEWVRVLRDGRAIGTFNYNGWGGKDKAIAGAERFIAQGGPIPDEDEQIDELLAEIDALQARVKELEAALRTAETIIVAAISFEEVAAEYLSESDYELNMGLSEPSAEIAVSGPDALKSVRAAITGKETP